MSNESDFTKHAVGWKWLAWGCLVLPLTLYIIKSTADTWPNLLTMAWLGGIATVGLSFYVAIHTTDSDTIVRNRALIAAVIVEIALIFNAVVHGGGSRAFENAEVAIAERRQEEDRAEKRRRQKAEDDRLASEAEAKRLQAEKLATDSAARLTDAEVRKYRTTGIIARPAPARAVPSPTSAPLIAAVADESPEVVAARKPVKLMTPAEALDAWYWWVFGGLMCEMFLSAVAAFMVLRERFADRNKNNVADWKERLDPEELAQRFPADYAKVYPQKQAGFTAPAVARGDNSPK